MVHKPHLNKAVRKQWNQSTVLQALQHDDQNTEKRMARRMHIFKN